MCVCVCVRVFCCVWYIEEIDSDRVCSVVECSDSEALLSGAFDSHIIKKGNVEDEPTGARRVHHCRRKMEERNKALDSGRKKGERNKVNGEKEKR